jgi:hypothetical protein
LESIGNSKDSAPKESTPSGEMANQLNREFSKEAVQMASKYMKKYSTSLL